MFGNVQQPPRKRRSDAGIEYTKTSYLSSTLQENDLQGHAVGWPQN